MTSNAKRLADLKTLELRSEFEEVTQTTHVLADGSIQYRHTAHTRVIRDVHDFKPSEVQTVPLLDTGDVTDPTDDGDASNVTAVVCIDCGLGEEDNVHETAVPLPFERDETDLTTQTRTAEMSDFDAGAYFRAKRRVYPVDPQELVNEPFFRGQNRYARENPDTGQPTPLPTTGTERQWWDDPADNPPPAPMARAPRRTVNADGKVVTLRGYELVASEPAADRVWYVYGLRQIVNTKEDAESVMRYSNRMWKLVQTIRKEMREAATSPPQAPASVWAL